MGETSGWVPKPDCGRGTLDILLECIFTILFAVWGTQHPDVQNLALRSRIKDAMIFLLFPELSALRAMEDFGKAWSLRKAVRPYQGSWTLKQSFAITMSAVYVAYTETAEPESRIYWDGWLDSWLEKARLKPKPPARVVIVEGEPGRVRLNLESQHHRLERVLPGSVLSQLPDDGELDKRSMAEGYAKLLGLIQALGFLFRNIVSRLAKDMKISLLEASTLGHLLCAVISSLAWLKKPQNLSEEFVIEISAHDAVGIERSGQINLTKDRKTAHVRLVVLTIVLVCCITGIYLGLTWNAPFPSLIEVWLWRGSIVACAVLGMVFPVTWVVSRGSAWVLAIAILYGSLRLAIIGQSIAAFRAAPKDIYHKPAWDWADYWPCFKL